MPIEDFTTYTEVDPNGRLTVTAVKATAVNADRDEDVYLYKDKGVDYFDALDEEFELLISSASLSSSVAGMALGNVSTGWIDFAATGLVVFAFYSGAAYFIYLRRGEPAEASDFYTGAANTVYYCRLERTAGNDTVTLKIYSDFARTSLLDTLTVGGFGTTKWRYIYGFTNNKDGNGDDDFDGYVRNLDLNELWQESVGGGAIPIAGALSEVLLFFQSVGGGAVTMAGSLSSQLKVLVNAVWDFFTWG